jgi:hypothetical protein
MIKLIIKVLTHKQSKISHIETSHLEIKETNHISQWRQVMKEAMK